MADVTSALHTTHGIAGTEKASAQLGHVQHQTRPRQTSVLSHACLEQAGPPAQWQLQPAGLPAASFTRSGSNSVGC